MLFIPCFSLLDLFFDFRHKQCAFNFILGYVAQKFDGHVMIMGLIQVQPVFNMPILTLYLLLSAVLSVRELLTLVVISHTVNFVRFILPNQVTTKSEDMFKTPALLESLVLWFYGTPDNPEVFD